MGSEKYICCCFKVTKKDVKEAIAKGADSFEKVKKQIHVSENCGHCGCKVKKYVKKRLKKQK